VALVHDYLNQQGGAEAVVEVFTTMFPGAPLYTSVYDADRMPSSWRGVDVRTSFLQRLSPRLSFARLFTPLYPSAFESFDLSEFDLVLSSTTTFAKGVVTGPATCHVCYCNTPTRFLWRYHDYLAHENLPTFARRLLPLLTTPLRVWDYAASQRVDFFVAGSRNAAQRIAKYYRRESQVVHSPIDSDFFHSTREAGDYFLVVARLQPYKRIDVAVQACTLLGLPLRVVGSGSDLTRLRAMAGPTVRFLGRVSSEEVRDQMSGCLALIFPGEEDFGLTPLEAMACGRPVIAYAAGGALETVKAGSTGLFFYEQTVESLCSLLSGFRDNFDRRVLREHAVAFDRSAFKEKMYATLARCYSEHLEQMG
jgi:glycosyltransferase involved in cell wall biosynthesis